MSAKRCRFAAVFGLVACVSLSAAADEITLRVADSFPVGHYAVEQGLKPFMEATTAQTGGEVQFEYFPASQLGKAADMMQLLQSGVADIAYIQPAYLADKLPLSALVGVPGLVKSSCSATRGYLSVGSPGGVLAEEEFTPNGMRLVYAVVTRPYQLQTKKELTSLDDLEGLKIRTGGGSQDTAVTTLGAVPVRVSGPEMYEALSRGTADAVILPMASVLSYDLQSLVSYSTKTASFGSTAILFMISDAAWNRLSPAQQEAMSTAGETASLEACEFVDGQFSDSIAKLTEAGVTVQDLPEAESAALAEKMSSVAEAWTEDMKGRGKPGAELLEDFQGAAQ